MPRYALLRHTGAPDDPIGCHVDLLLEDGDTCRTWRLVTVPLLNRERQPAVPLPPHRLVWLEPRSAAVSGNRGWAERIHSGSYSGVLPIATDAAVTLQLKGDLQGRLHIAEGYCCLSNP
ncbi:hypothetical protein KR52_04875 [Synechococcus sp. KORDI-52]|uniref:hypothetical protein n=1 Tax=Synechococcus sp. KORDI-52 TaxID=585425 RepID=UPI0004E08948|nr:hypothetical protein [Synechococcus sp. KORDI-52]AII48479.1 hypothetical protein KR52_04875 [Synechococcus sp. KORDI-52]